MAAHVIHVNGDVFIADTETGRVHPRPEPQDTAPMSEEPDQTATPTSDGASALLYATDAIDIEDIRYGAGGHFTALHYLVRAMQELVGIDRMELAANTPTSSMFARSLHWADPALAIDLLRGRYGGVFADTARRVADAPNLQLPGLPVVLPVYAMRGHNGRIANEVLIWYSKLRPYDRFIVPTRSVRAYYEGLEVDGDAFHVSHYGVNHDEFTRTDERAARVRIAEIVGDERVLTHPIVGFLSRLQPEKGGVTFIRLARMIPEALFLAVAPTFMFYEHGDLPLPENFLYAGRQPRELLPVFLNAFDMHVFRTVVEEETFGMVALEAMACGTPVIASDFDGLPEVIGDAGVLTPTQTHDTELASVVGHVDIEAMAYAVRDLVADEPKRRALGEAAHKRSLGFTWEKAAADVVDLFEKLGRLRDHPMPQIPDADVFFTPYFDEKDGRVDVRAILAGVDQDKRLFLMFESYVQTVEEGLALALLKTRPWGEVAAVMQECCGREGAVDVMRRIREFLLTLSV